MESSLPDLLPVRQIFDPQRLTDVAGSTQQAVSRALEEYPIAPGGRVALGVGSRGIGDLQTIVRATVDACIAAGLSVEIVPAMGSHGGGTAAGQIEVLAGLGITEEKMGAIVSSSMDVVTIGNAAAGSTVVPVMVDATLSSYDAVIPINRIKPHTDYQGDHESGLCKMLAIGFGNHEGCSRIHQEGFPAFPEVVPAVAQVILDTLPIPFGIAIVENAFDQTLLVEAVAAKHIISREAELLRVAYANMPALHLKHIDVLVVERIGKDISGAGMDPNVVGRTTAGILPGYSGPAITRIIVAGITPASHGNAIGVGLADFVTESMAHAIDREATWANAIASGNPESGRIPVVMPTLEDALRGALLTSGVRDWHQARIVSIPDTLHLEKIRVSPALLQEVRENPLLVEVVREL